MLKNLSIQKRVFILLGLLSLASIAFIASNLRPSNITPVPTPTPPSQITSTNPQIAALKPEKYSLSPSLTFPFPKTLPVYSATPPTPIYLAPLFKQFISLYKLEPSSKFTSYYYSKDKSIIVMFDSQNQYLTYSIDGTIRPSAYIGNSPPSFTTALQSAKKFLSQFSDYNNLEPQKDHVGYSLTTKVGSEPKPVTDPKQANLITIPFTYYISEYVYRHSSATSSPVVITVGQNNEIISAYFSPQPIPTLSQSKDKTLLTSNQILAALNAGQGSILYAPLYYLPGNTTDLPPTTITSIQIEYRFDSANNQVLPYFSLWGQFYPETNSSTPIEINIILPAVTL